MTKSGVRIAFLSRVLTCAAPTGAYVLPAYLPRRQQDHHALLAAFKRRDTAAAVALLEAHIAETQKALLAASG